MRPSLRQISVVRRIEAKSNAQSRLYRYHTVSIRARWPVFSPERLVPKRGDSFRESALNGHDDGHDTDITQKLNGEKKRRI